jgi:hypothetical protein
MKYKLFIVFILASLTTMAQELYVFTEPASNMAAKSIGLRLNNYIMPETYTSKTNYHLIPEIMVGVSKRLMVHGDVFFSNRNKALSAEGGSVYAKYRFLSHDDVQKHFRMAAYSRYSFNNSDIHQEEINLYGHNTGYELGIIATQLLHKVAISTGLSFLKALDNGSGNKYPYSGSTKAINYTLSVGKLLLPKEYKDYKQTNVNLMLEFLNQYNPGPKRYYIDVAPSVQFIVNSVARIDLGYRKELRSTLYRTAPDGLFVRLEYNFFNVY